MAPSLRTWLAFVSLTACVSPLAACSQSAEDDANEDGESAIVGGTTSGMQDDAVVALFRRGKPWCAGTVIAPNVLLTALHCVADTRSQGNDFTVGAMLQPNELSVHMGSKPSPTRSAIVTRIVPPPAIATAGASLKSNDIALVYVQPVDPAFSRIAPKTLAPRSVASDETISVVGYTDVSVDPFGLFTSAERQRKDDVYVWAGAAERALVRAELEDGRAFFWRNRAAEFTSETVACGSDSGGPALDLNGNVVGVVAGVVGECVPGSLSVFTDVGSHAAFIRQAVQTTSTGSMCFTDTQCGPVGSGKICDARTARCMLGCRSGGATCATGATCTAQTAPVGTIGICRTTSNPNDPSDPAYDLGPYTAPVGATCPGDPLCPTPAGTRECRADSECAAASTLTPATPAPTSGTPTPIAGTAGATMARICDIPRGRCIEGCRLGAAGAAPAANGCAQGMTCAASVDNPQVGVCQAATTPTPAEGSPPGAAPSYASEPVSPTTTPDVTTSAGGADGGATGKKKKKNAAKDGGGCSVVATTAGASSASWIALLGLAVAGLRRRKQAGSTEQA